MNCLHLECIGITTFLKSQILNVWLMLYLRFIAKNVHETVTYSVGDSVYRIWHIRKSRLIMICDNLLTLSTVVINFTYMLYALPARVYQRQTCYFHCNATVSRPTFWRVVLSCFSSSVCGRWTRCSYVPVNLEGVDIGSLAWVCVSPPTMLVVGQTVNIICKIRRHVLSEWGWSILRENKCEYVF